MPLPIFKQAQAHPERSAIFSDEQIYSYADLLQAAEGFALQLLHAQADLAEARVAYMVNPGFDYVSTQWGIWKAGGVAVPLCISYHCRRCNTCWKIPKPKSWWFRQSLNPF